MLKNIHVTIGETELCLTELVNKILAFILAIVKAEFPEFEEVIE